MIKFIPLFFLLACATSHPAVSPPEVTSPPRADTVYIPVHDTVKIDRPIQVIVDHYVAVPQDTINDVIKISPTGADDYPVLQAAIDYCIVTPGHRIRLTPGNFRLSHPLIVARIVNGIYQQVSIDIEGATYAKNTPAQYTSNLICGFTAGFAIGIQQGKGCVIKNLSFQGTYHFPDGLNTVQIDTLGVQEWPEDSRTSPYSGVVIDPFSDSTLYDGVVNKMYDGLHSYYLPGMNRSGSTAVKITGCNIQNFTVGVMITPSNQQNGELIDVDDNQIGHCKVAYAFSQAQSKANTLNNLMVWGRVRTIIDGQDYGFWQSDGQTCPFVDNMSVAGSVYELIKAQALTFPITLNRVYAEGLFKIGVLGGSTNTYLRDCQIDLQVADPSVPSPDFIMWGQNIYVQGGQIRVYNGATTANRIVLNYGHFSNMEMSNYPVVANTPPAVLQNISLYYNQGVGLINSNAYDSIPWITAANIRVNKANYTGYFTVNPVRLGGVLPGDLLLCTKNYTELPGLRTDQYPVGYVTSISADTIFLKNIGVGIADGELLNVVVAKVVKL